ncbi:MAG: NAD(P)(+) transhydrogenase (Re/Si-specific) subunit beta [Gemmatimonadales bacterium]|nr:NAD(P)(+) transhydrogenase (Re/Si-specific) subunit beta [Gemmatimonadales bacterium]
MSLAITKLAYLIAAVCFILGLKWLSSPGTAVRGNRVSGVGMLIAILVTLANQGILSYTVIAAGILVGGGLGLWMARTVQMTSMPQMVALLNGLGGGAARAAGAP